MPKKNKIVYKYEGGARQRASGTISDTMSDIMTNDIMTKYKTLKRCRLPDLDLTVPVSTEVTWGRPLTQEEIDHLRAWSQADASVHEVKGMATIERMNAVFGSLHEQDVQPKDKDV